MSSWGGYGGWEETPADKKKRLAKEKAERERKEREDAEWARQGYVDFDYKPPRTLDPKSFVDRVTTAEILGHDHIRLRQVLSDLEELAAQPSWDEKSAKQLDKALVMAKSSAKMIAKVLKANGFRKVREHKSASVVGAA